MKTKLYDLMITKKALQRRTADQVTDVRSIYGRTYRGSKRDLELEKITEAIRKPLRLLEIEFATELVASRQEFRQTSEGYTDRSILGSLLLEEDGLKLIYTADNVEPFYLLDEANRYTRLRYSADETESFNNFVKNHTVGMSLGARQLAAHAA